MSAFLAVRYPEHIEILTDAARQGECGAPEVPARKVWASPHCAIAVTGRGNYAYIQGIARGVMKMAESGSVDRVFDALQSLFTSHRSNGIVEMPAEFLIGGFSETAGPIAWYIAGAGTEALAPQWVEELAYAGPSIDIAAIARLDKGLRVPARYVFEAVRRAPGGDSVGGWLDLTIIGVNGSRIEKLDIW